MDKVCIRDEKNGQMMCEENDGRIADIFINEDILPDIRGVLVCVHWNGHHHLYASSVSLQPRGKSYESCYIQTLLSTESNWETFVHEAFATCGLMLLRVTVFPLAFILLHPEEDTITKERRKLFKLLKKLLLPSGLTVQKLEVRRKRRVYLCYSFGHSNFNNESYVMDVPNKVMPSETVEETCRFSSLYTELEELSILLQEKLHFLNQQQDRLIATVCKAAALLKQKISNPEAIESTSKQNVYAEMLKKKHTFILCKLAEQNSAKINQQREVGFKHSSASSSGKDVGKAHHDNGVNYEDSEDIREILQGSVDAQTQRMLVDAIAGKFKADSTTCVRNVMSLLLRTDAFDLRRPENTRMWWDIHTALRSEEQDVASKTALDTVICIATSGGLDDRAFQGVKEIILSLLGGLEDISSKDGIEENVGLVIGQAEKPVVHPMSKTYEGIRAALNSIKELGATMLRKALFSVLACLTKDDVLTANYFSIPTRLVFFTDGPAPDDEEEMKKLFLAVRSLSGVHIQKTILHEIVWIPTPKADTELVKKLADISNGKYVEGNDAFDLYKYQKLEVQTAMVHAYMKAKGVDPYQLPFDEVFDILELTLDPLDKVQIQNAVSYQLREKPADLRRMDVFTNIVLHGNLPQLGTRVEKGPDWNSEDIVSELYGTVVNHGEDGRTVWVFWDNGTIDEYGYNDEMGYHVVVSTEPRGLHTDSLTVGVQVERGPHWSFDNEDGGRNSGVVIRQSSRKVKVIWENGAMHDYVYGEDRFEIWIKR